MNDVSDWALAEMQWAVGNDLMNGTGDNLISPKREQPGTVAAIMQRYYINFVTKGTSCRTKRDKRGRTPSVTIGTKGDVPRLSPFGGMGTLGCVKIVILSASGESWLA